MVATVPQNMPATNSPMVDPRNGYITQPWLYLLTSLWNRTGGSGGGGGTGAYPGDLRTIADLQALTGHGDTTSYLVEGYYAPGDNGGGIFVFVEFDTTSADNGGTIIVDGDGNRWYRLFTGAACVQWFGAVGNGLHNDTAGIQACLDAHVDVFVPAGDWLITSISMGDAPGRKFRGAGSLATTIYSNAADGPAIICPSTIYYMEISGFYVERLGAAVAFDDGIQTLALLASPTFADLILAHQYVGIRLQAADSGFVTQCYAIGNATYGFLLANLNSGAGAGQVQYLLTDCFSSVNGGDGFAVVATGTGPTQIALGTWTNCQSFANSGHGVAVYGQPGQPVNGLRLQGGFFGEDGASEIYLDSYGGGHVICPSYLELCGRSVTGPTLSTPASHVGSGMEFTANNDSVEVGCKVTNGHSYDGLISSATNITIGPGAYQNNGLQGTAFRQNGIFILAASSIVISGVRAGNVNGNTTQQFGVAANVDCLAMAACDLRNNTTSWTALISTTASNIAGCLPHEANDTYCQTLHVLGQSAFASTLNITAGGIAMTTGVVGNGIVTDNIFVQKGVGIGIAPTGAVGELRATGTVAFTGAGGVNITGSAGLAVTNGINANDISITRSLGVGTPATAVAGRINSTSLVLSGTFTAASLSATTITGGTITSSTDLIANGQFHGNGSSAFAAGLNLAGSLAMTGLAGITCNNITVNNSIGVGLAASGAVGVVNVSSAVQNNGTPYTFP